MIVINKVYITFRIIKQLKIKIKGNVVGDLGDSDDDEIG